MTSIQFAKDGWFGVISDEINFENMTIIAQGVADYLNESCDTSASVVIGYDTRFLSREYAWAIQQVLTGNRIRVFFHKKPAPTSFLSLSARLYKADLGIMVTGKGRPARYSGMVFRSSQGRPLGRDFLSSLFNHLYRRYPRAADENRDLLTYIDVSKAYMDLLSGLITIKRPGPKMPLVISDSCFGSVGGYIKDILRHYGFNTIAIRTKPNPGFMDCVPYPSPRNMQPTFRLIQQRHGQIGLFFSGDGSSLGVIDSRGHIVPDQWVSAIVLKEWLDLAGEDYKVYTDIFTPSISVPILSYRGLAVRAPMYELFEQTEQEEETESYIVWDRQSIYCSDFIPDRDAMFQAMVFVSALVRHEYDWDTMLAGLLRITGMRTFLYRSIKLNKNIWSRKKTLLESYGRIGSLGNIIDMQEEDEDLKLWMMDGSWAGLSYNSAEDHLSMYYDGPRQNQAESKMNFLVNFMSR